MAFHWSQIFNYVKIDIGFIPNCDWPMFGVCSYKLASKIARYVINILTFEDAKWRRTVFEKSENI